MADQPAAPTPMPALLPGLTASDPQATLDWFEKLGFEPTSVMELPDGSIGHAMLMRGGVGLMIGPCMQHQPGSSGMDLWIDVGEADLDALCEDARDEGIAVTQEPHDEFWGDRIFEVTDPDGYRLVFRKHVRDVTPEEMQTAMAELMSAETSA
ncbi:MAG TPA: VOC family protein [Chloroflexota bacterium]|jgi:uncharacterized glyoxalase superfamily protein PhnB